MKKALIFLTLVCTAVLIAGCLNVATHTKVDRSGNITSLKMEINTTSYVYNLLVENIQKEGYSSMEDYIKSNYSRTMDGAAGTGTVEYSEEWSGDRVKMIVDLEGQIKPTDDSGIRITREGDFLTYELSMEDEGGASSQYPSDADYSNLSDAMLGAITFDYYLEMPGKIVDSNANAVKDNKAEWHFNGKTMSNTKRLYAKSEVPKTPGFEGMIALLAVLGGCGLAARTSKKEK